MIEGTPTAVLPLTATGEFPKLSSVVGDAGLAEFSQIDRLSVRQRPGGWPILYQTWDQLLFLHWPVPPEQLRPLIPAGLEIDTWDGTAWIGITPFTMRRIRPVLTPSLPWVSSSHELNVRTYVHCGGVPGVWFLSLDASNLLAVWGARLAFFLPYYRASMQLQSNGGRTAFHSVREHPLAPPASFQAAWRRGARLPSAAPETRDFFLIERYCLYSARGDTLYRARIHHHPWPLCTADIEDYSSNMIESHGLAARSDSPIVHAQAEPLRVGIWPPKSLA